jgi:hypothetical protein
MDAAIAFPSPNCCMALPAGVKAKRPCFFQRSSKPTNEIIDKTVVISNRKDCQLKADNEDAVNSN